MPLLNRGGRPGLLAMAARTAVVSGTATAVSGAVARRQHDRAMQARAAAPTPQVPQAPPTAPTYAAPAAPAAPADDVVAKLQQLGALHQQGLLSADEFALAKQQLLGL